MNDANKSNRGRGDPMLDKQPETETMWAIFWLRLTGQEGVKLFLQAELGHQLNETVAQAAGLH